jgi:hypothetical protein
MHSSTLVVLITCRSLNALDCPGPWIERLLYAPESDWGRYQALGYFISSCVQFDLVLLAGGHGSVLLYLLFHDIPRHRTLVSLVADESGFMSLE